MKTDLSPAAEKALTLSRTDSTVDEIDLSRLFSSLIADEESLPAERLLAAGCLLAELRHLVDGMGPLLAYQRKFLVVARETATDHMESTITGEHLLMSLLRTDSRFGALITRAGGELETLLRTHAPEVLRTEEHAPHPLAIRLPAAKPSGDNLPALRICDVNSNRIRESLRILDDHARFVRNAPAQTELIKNLRHDFVAILRDHPKLVDLAARDTTGDVGTAISTPSEHARTDPANVALVNVKRLQESLRSLEEFGKILDPMAAARIEQLRYRSYTLEREMFVESPARTRLQSAKLYLLVTSDNCRLGLEATVKGALAGGVSVVQLREKSMEDRSLLDSAWKIRQWTREADALFIINDRPDVARMSEADGVHLGQEDFPPASVRKMLPAEMLIGLSTHNPGQLTDALGAGADYVGVGPTFPSTTKQFEEFAGLEFVRQAMALSTVPAFAIGGINRQTIRAVAEAGAKRIAVSAVISQSEHPEQTARELLGFL